VGRVLCLMTFACDTGHAPSLPFPEMNSGVCIYQKRRCICVETGRAPYREGEIPGKDKKTQERTKSLDN